jgi:proteasome accessory factor C
MVSRPTAPDRMRRVLAVVPWIVANPGRTVGEVAARFQISEDELLDDLNVVFMVGLPPYSPDALVDVEIDDEGRVNIRLADFFSRPLRLTPSQGLALLASSDGLLSIPGTDSAGALARALEKLGKVLGVGPDEAVDVHLGEAEATMLDQLRAAATGGREVEIVYYSYGRDERAARTIIPWRVFSDAGAWYVYGWCRLAGGERLFRLDRIESLALLGPVTEHPWAGSLDPDDPVSVFQPQPGDPRVTIRLRRDAAWVADTYPVTVIESGEEGVVVELVVSATPWLERLLVRLGEAAEIVSSESIDDAAHLASRTAARMLTRYRSP